MEALYIYLIKSGLLLLLFYLGYHFLLRKETFFTTNRWYLLVGLFTSVLLPLFFITKVVLIEAEPVFEHIVPLAPITTGASSQPAVYSSATATLAQSEPINWINIAGILYMLIASALSFKIVVDLFSLYKLLYRKNKIKKEQFSLIDLEENIAPFSFFNYIIFNSAFYTNDELASILSHEKIHSQEKHSIDILIANIFCIVFWFNPIVWLYKKAITHNLEFIADHKAIQNFKDKKAYQKALLKVVSHQNCVSITNHFYQSLIKKRIVMLNKNQSRKSNYWKYLFVLPVVAAFLFYFQVKIIAQEKMYPVVSSPAESTMNAKSSFVLKICKDLTDKDLKSIEENFKSDNGVKFSISKVKRNKSGEITRIKVSFRDKNGFKKDYTQETSEAIKPVNFVIKFNGTGISDIQFNEENNKHNICTNGTRNNNDNESFEGAADGSLPLNVSISENINISDIVNTALATAQNNLNFETLNFNDANLSEEEKKEIKAELEKAKIEIQKARIEVENAKPEIERARREVERSKPEIERAKREIERMKPELERAKKEIERAKKEIERETSKIAKNLSEDEAKTVRRELENAKKEIENARKEIEKQQAELDKKK